MAARRRLDAELVRRELASNSAQARELVESGRVTVSGAPALKPARMVDPGEAVVVLSDGPRFVSRAGEKLDAALDRFAVNPAGRRVIDVGSSTGGFTDCVLQRGAKETVAIDVGRNQLHEKLRADERVAVHEQTNVRYTSPDDVGGPGDLVVADLSFISLRTVAEPILGLARAGADLLLLVKPQFEANKAEADKGRGIIRDPAVWLDTLILASGALSAAGAAIMGVMVSPITGGDGNVEFLVHARAHDEPATEVDVLAWAQAAVVDAENL